VVTGRNYPSKEDKGAFAGKLRAAMERKGWSPSQTARAASRLLASGEQISDAHMWHYLRGSVPRARYLEALSQALDVSSQELVPSAQPIELAVIDIPSTRSAAQTITPPAASPVALQVRDLKNGSARIEICDEVPWSTAIEILRLLNGSGGRQE
jgi:transcriptional regulator with XRE-family HTH domain